MKIKAIFFLSLLAFNTFAGQDRGGGSGVVCRNDDGKITSVEVLDYYEAKTLLSLNLDLGPKDLGYVDKVKLVAQRLKRVDKILSDYLVREIENFESNSSFISTSDLTRISDFSSPVTPPEGCNIVQMAANKVSPLPFEKIFLVNADLWMKSNNQTKAGLALHEILFRFGRSYPQVVATSDQIRYFNALISSSEFENMDTQSYVALSSRIPVIISVLWKGRTYLATGAEFYPEGAIKEAYPIDSDFITPQGLLRTVTSKKVGLYPDGSLREISVAEGTVLRTSAGDFTTQRAVLEFFPGGFVMHLHGWYGLSLGGSRFWAMFIKFNSDGSLYSFAAPNGAKVRLSKTYKLKAGNVYVICGDDTLSPVEAPNCQRY